MATYDYTKPVDWAKIKVGDILLSRYDNPTYVGEIHARSSSKPNLISPEFSITLVEYHHSFQSKKTPGAGYSFPCFRDGAFSTSEFNKRFATLRDDPDYVYEGIEAYQNHFNEPAIIRCTGTIWNKKTKTSRECGNEVALEMVMTNTCDKCHTDYNSSGQRLASREQWGWDTGESLSEILASDFSINDPIPGREFDDGY